MPFSPSTGTLMTLSWWAPADIVVVPARKVSGTDSRQVKGDFAQNSDDFPLINFVVRSESVKSRPNPAGNVCYSFTAIEIVHPVAKYYDPPRLHPVLHIHPSKYFLRFRLIYSLQRLWLQSVHRRYQAPPCERTLESVCITNLRP